MKTTTQAHIRWMLRADVPHVVAIDRLGNTHPWDEDTLLTALVQRSCIAFVAVPGGSNTNDQPFAFLVYNLRRNHIEIARLTVEPCWRASGIGRQLAAKLKTKLSAHRRTWLSVRVRETNTGGLRFLAKQGFKSVAMLPNYYAGSAEGEPAEDGVLMQYCLSQ